MFKINKFLLTIISNDKFFFVLETNLIPFYLIFFFSSDIFLNYLNILQSQILISYSADYRNFNHIYFDKSFFLLKKKKNYSNSEI